jgi:hypothetical protein
MTSQQQADEALAAYRAAKVALSQTRAEYLRGECDLIHAIEMLQSHCGMSSREAETEVYSWEDG